MLRGWVDGLYCGIGMSRFLLRWSCDQGGCGGYLVGGDIRYWDYGFNGFRSYSGSLLVERKSKQNALAPPLGASLWLGMPALRLESVGRR
ncbi:MAG: hypothetical protein WBB95_27335, partial [Pseudomonas sp.]